MKRWFSSSLKSLPNRKDCSRIQNRFWVHVIHSFGCFASRWNWPKSPFHHEYTLSNSVFKQTVNLKFTTPKTKTESSLREALTTQARQNNLFGKEYTFLCGKDAYVLSRNSVIFYHPRLIGCIWTTIRDPYFGRGSFFVEFILAGWGHVCRQKNL